MKKGWELARLDTVIINFIVPQRDRPKVFDGDVPWCRIEDFDGIYLSKSKSGLCVSEALIESMPLRVYPADTVIVSCSADLGRCAIIARPLITNQTFIGLVPSENIKPLYLYYLMGHKADHLNAIASGAIIKYLSKKKFQELEIPIPPLSEQEEIVEVLDTAFAAIDQAKANIEQNIANANELFQSKLNQIFSQKGEGWVETTLGDIGTLTSSKRIFKKDYVSSGIPFYRSKEIKELAHGREISLELFITKERYEEIKNKFGIPQKGDILLTAVGTIGEMYVVKGHEEFYFKDGNLMWLKNFDTLDSYYLKYALTHFVDQLKAMSRGAAYSALTIEKLKKYSIPVPNDKIQREMVLLLDSFKAQQEQLIEAYQTKLASLDELKKSILQKAFAGELTN